MQTFDTVALGSYHVTFQYVLQQGTEFEDLLAETLNVTTVLAPRAIRFNNLRWVTQPLDFTATGTSTTLRFTDTTGVVDPALGNSTNWALDAVTVVRTDVTGVPEPSSLTFVGLGSLAAFVLRKRTRRE